MRATEFIQRCLDAGMPLDMALMASKAFEAEVHIAVEEALEVQRSKARARQAKHRADKAAREHNVNNVTSRDSALDDVKPVPERDLTCGRTQVVIPSSSLRSEDVVVVAERASDPQTDDWPKGNGPHLAKLLVAEVDSHWLDLSRSGGLNTSTGRFLAWKREGASWEHDVVPVVTAVCAKRKSRVNSWQFFDEAIAASIAANRAALEIPEASRVIPLRPGGGFKSREEQNREGWDYAIARIAADE